MSQRNSLAAPAWLAFWLWLAAFGRLAEAADWSPAERTDQPWKVVSLLEDGGLGHLNVFNLDFEKNTNSARWGTAWIATSDGLHEYDGYTWRRHGRADGLPSDFVRCVLVTRAGQIWVGTDQGAGLYDGKTFRTLGSETNLAGPNVRRITEDTDGSIWFCSDSWPNAGAGGGLTSLRAGQWKAYREADGLPSSYVVNYFRDRSGRQFAATLKGLAEFGAGRWGMAFPAPSGQTINWGSGCLAETAASGLLYSTGREVFRLNAGVWSQLPAGTPHEHGIVATADGAVVAVGRPNGGRSVFLEWSDDRWVPASSEFSTPRGYTEDIRAAPDGSVWVAGYDCLARWARKGSQWREFTNLPPPKLVDAQGGVWFARTRGLFTPGGPAVRLQQGRWEPLGAAFDELVNHRRDDSVWGWTSNRLTRWQGTNRTDFTSAQTGLESYAAGYGDGRRTFWLVGNTPAGAVAVAKHSGNRWQTVPVPELAGMQPWRTAASTSNGVWIAGDRGVGTTAVLVRVSPTGNLRLDAPAQRIGTMGMNFLEDRYGAVWLYGDAGLFRWVLGKSTQWDSIGDLPSKSVVSCVERGDELWFGYNGATGGRSAIIGLRNGQWTNFPVATLGNLTVADDGTVFADGVGQVFRIANRPDAAPLSQGLRTPETVTSVVQADDGVLWVGADDRVFRFQSYESPLKVVLTGEKRVHANEPLSVSVTALDRFHPKGARQGVLCSWRVDGSEWSPFVTDERIAIQAEAFTRGPHLLEVRCADSAGNRVSQPAAFDFRVAAVPLQEQAWFVPGMLSSAAVMTALALVAINARRRVAEYARTLERKVAERTADLEADIQRRQVVEASLRLSEQRFSTLFQSSPTLTIVSELSGGCIMDVNQMFCAVLGFTRDELIGRRTLELGLWDDPRQRAAVIDQVVRTGSVRNAEVRMRTRTGRPLEILLSGERVDFAGSPAVLLLGVDVTGHRELEARLRHIGDNLPGSYVYQYSHEPDGTARFHHLSGSVERVHGITAEAVVRDPAVLLGLVDPAQLPALQAAEAVSARELSDFSLELRICHRNGKWGWFKLRSRPRRDAGGRVTWDGVVTDVTARREAEDALRLQELHARSLLRLSRKLERAESQADILRAVREEVEEVIGFRRVWLYLFSEDRTIFELVGTDGGTAAPVPVESGLRVPVAGDPMLEEIVASGEVVVVKDAQTDPRTNKTLVERMGNRTLVHVPVQLAGKRLAAIGTGSFGDEGVRSLTSAERAYLTAVASQAAAVINRVAAAAARLEADAALRSSEERLRMVTGNARIGLVMVDGDRRYTYANAAYSEIFGLPPEDLVGLRVEDLLPSLYEGQIRPHLDLAFAGQRVAYEISRPAADGERHYAVRYEPMTVGDAVTNVVAVITDITERRRAEEARQESEGRLSFALHAGQIGAWQLNLADLTVRRTLLHDQIFGYFPPLPRWSYELFVEHVVPEDRAEVDRMFRESVATVSSFGFECRIRRADGQIRWIMAAGGHEHTSVGRSMRMSGIVQDITERKRAEEARQASEARYRALFEYAPDGILIGDAESNYLDANASMCRMLGYTHDELVGLNATDIVAPAEVSLIRPTIDAIHGRSDHHQEWTFRRKDGSLFPVEVRATQTPDGNIVGLVRDLTERKRSEAALRAKDELLRLVIDLVPHFIFAKDRESRYLFANRAVADSLGLAPEQLVGRDARDLGREPAEAEAFMRDDREVISRGIPKFVPAEKLTDAQGRVHIHQTTKIPFRVPGTDEPALLGVAIDITEQQRMERLLAWEMEALERLVSNASLEELLRELVLGVEQHAPGALCSILLLDDEGVRLRHGAAPSLPEAYNQAIDGILIGPRVGSCGTAAATRQLVVVTDIATDPHWTEFRELAMSHGLRACWSAPIFGRAGNVWGTFAVYYRHPETPRPAELELISRVQHLAGLAIERKRAEESLQMTRLSVDRAGDSIFWLGRDGRIRYANEAACTGRGYSRQELLGMTIFDLDPDYQPDAWSAHFEELKRQGTLTLETRHRTKDGRLFPIEVNANYVFIRGEEFNFCFMRDITGRRRVERRRDVEHTVSRILAESASLAVATPKILEAIGTSEGWKFGELWKVDGTDGRLVCQETWSVPGLQDDELEAETRRLRFGPGEGLPGGVYQGGEVTVIPDVGEDARFIRAKAAAAAGLVGAVAFPLRADGPIAGVLVFLTDQRMEVDPELTETLSTLGNQVGQFMARQLVQEELRRFVALSPSVIYALRITSSGLRAYWVSENVFTLTGYHPSESIHGTWWADHLHPEDRERVLRETVGVGGVDHQVMEFRFRRKDGSYLSLRDEKRLLRDATGKPVEIVGAWTDITDRVNLEKQLRQAQKMEAIGLLSGGIAHDFNNLLGTVIGNAQLAALDLDPDHPATESLEQILTAGRRATHLVQQILTFARRERTERHRVNPLPVVEESVRLLRATLPAAVHLSLLKGEKLPAVMADETQIQQVLINLGTNAWHAFDGGPGRISVELSAVEVDTELAATSPDLRPGPYLRIRVEDTGKGMDAGTLERIFEPFFTTKEVGKGTGLGLSVVHGIMKAHGGAITVQSAVGVGTTFDLFIPAAPGDDASGPAAANTELKSGRGEQLLLIDDQSEMLRTNRRALERLGYRVVACKDAAEAQVRFRAEPEAFALVLTDLNMPGMSGVDLARILLGQRPGLPVLLTSGFITEDLRQSALAAGVRDILRKPVTLQDLSEAIAKNLHPQT